MKDLRVNYTKGELLESSIPDSPFELFDIWFNQAVDSKQLEANAMVVSTAADNKVNSRTVLLKDLRKGGFVFYTNYNSQKAAELAANEYVSLLFPWYALERQVIVRGKATKVSKEESEAYFNSRPFESRLGAHASNQSSEIESRESLEANFKATKDKFNLWNLEKPEHWGGYEVIPYEIEFWQGRPNRMHDRICYYEKNGVWTYKRLQP
jgi:pyridoxamine 5'-phosphate oxidase